MKSPLGAQVKGGRQDPAAGAGGRLGGKPTAGGLESTVLPRAVSLCWVLGCRGQVDSYQLVGTTLDRGVESLPIDR